jgi:outer membrane biosynthesis protein TonB
MIRSNDHLIQSEHRPEKDADFVISLVLSLVLHLIIAYLFFFGAPTIFRSLPEEQVIITEVLPISSATNIKPKKTIEKETKEEPTSSEKDVAKSKSEEVKEEEKSAKEKKEPPIPEEKDKELIPSKEQKKPEKKEEKKEEKKPETKPKPKEKPKEEKKKKAKSADDDFESLLQNLEKAAKSDPSKKKASETADVQKSKKAQGEFNPDQQLSVTEQHAIKAQIERFWNVPIGVKNAGSIKITLYISLKMDGTVEKIALVDQKCSIDNARECQAAIDSAIRAVNMASPLEGLSAARYEYWKEFNFEFDPSEIAN